MQVTITIPVPVTLLRQWRWALIGVLALAAALSLPVGKVPLTEASGGVQMVAVGRSHSCAVTSVGGLKCWGDNQDGKLGDGTVTFRPAPVDVLGLTSGVSAVAAGESHTCALTAAGGVKCWGGNQQGALGAGPACGYYYCTTPLDVSGLTSSVVAISVGDAHSCALTAAGGVKCWGWNLDGQIGDGTNDNRLTPVDVLGLTSGVIALAAGDRFTCAVTTDGGAKCWGNGFTYGYYSYGNVPVDITGLTSGVAAVSAGTGHACALTVTGGLKCWGSNGEGQLGDGTLNDSNTPVNVLGLESGVAMVAAGGFHTCAVKTSGGMKCWGWNFDGQLGDGGVTTGRTVAADVLGLESGVASVNGGFRFTCGVTLAGGVKCWGDGGSGQLGDGQFTGRQTLPVDVAGLGPKNPTSQISVTNLGQYALPKTCFQVENGLDLTPLFTVCDNDFQGPPVTSPVCEPDGVCQDEDLARGQVKVTVSSGGYVVSESKPAPNHSPPSGAQSCTGQCALTFLNTPNTQPWHPWDVNGDGIVLSADITDVINHYGLEKPLQ